MGMPTGPTARASCVAVVLALLAMGCGSSPAQTGPATGPPQPKLSVGADATTVGESTVPPSGGVVAISKPGDPLDGLAIEVPAGAFGAPVTFRVARRDITGLSLGEGFAIASPLVAVDDGGAGYAGEILTVRIPSRLAPGHFPLAIYYDPATGAMEGLPAVAADDASVTVLTRHFSDVAILDVDPNVLDRLDPATGFALGRDDWGIKNAGSALSPGGYCGGMVLTEAWAFDPSSATQGTPLFDQHPNGLGPGLETPHFWQDDATAIRLASVVQVDVHPVRGKVYDKVSSFLEKRTAAGSDRPFNAIQFYSFVAALHAFKQPQIAHLDDPQGRASHFVLVYGERAGRLLVADPNTPGGTSPLGGTIDYTAGAAGADGTFAAYVSAESAWDLLLKRFNRYSVITFAGSSALADLPRLASLWGQFGDGTIGRSRFPAYSLRVSELTSDLEIATEYPLDRTSGARSERRLIRVELDSPFDGRLSVFRWEAVQAWEASYEPGISTSPSPLPTVNGVNIIDLRPGTNLLGFYVEVPSGQDWTWAGFDWVTITYEPQASPTPTGTPGTSASAAATASPISSPAAGTSPPPVAAFTDADCTCPGVFAAPYATTKRSEGPELRCKWGYGPGVGTASAYNYAIVNTFAGNDPQAVFDRYVADFTSALARENMHEGQMSFLREPDVLTVITRPDPPNTYYKLGYRWEGHRVVKHRGTVFTLGVAFLGTDGGDDDAVLESLDAVQACSERALDRVGAP